MDLKDIAPGMLLVDVNGKLCVVKGISGSRPKNPVVYQHAPGRSTYIGPPDFFTRKVGTVDLVEFDKEAAPRSPTAPAFGSLFGPRSTLPPALAGKKVGDQISVRIRGVVTTVEFMGVNPSAPRNPLKIRMGGREYKGPFSLLVGQGQADKRPEKQIMADIAGTYAALSPENLSCDGELPEKRVRQKELSLRARLEQLFTELGRRVSDKDAYAATAEFGWT